MTSIKTALAQASSFAELAPIIRAAREGVSFWGKRYVHVNGYEGKALIDDLATCVTELFWRNINERIEFNDEDCRSGAEIAVRIRCLYNENNHRNIHNPITWLLCKIRDIWKNRIRNLGYGPHPHKQFHAVFWSEPKGICALENPNRWPVPEIS